MKEPSLELEFRDVYLALENRVDFPFVSKHFHFHFLELDKVGHLAYSLRRYVFSLLPPT